VHGLWLLVQGREFFLPFLEFPWFEEALLRHVLNVQLAGPNHLYWPDLDVDLSIESIEHPEMFPIVFEPRPNKALRPSVSRVTPRAKGKHGPRRAARC
jgi:hypothetical protein